ncbi:MAG TPA: dihydroorotase [Candidatus Saccharicenans sp.]|nr:dihydroorotase [Candidatus Saccharicenans sp.]HRD02341.1 dihydroorotase [Candidatus Saccharicenans sp.]
MKLLIKRAWVLDPGEKIEGEFDLLLVDGRLAEIKPDLELEADRTIKATGFLITPGFIDLHTHLREPGDEHKETIKSGGQAAARGGFTTICCMPNTRPVNDRPEITRDIIDMARKESPVRVLPIAAVSREGKGQELSPMTELAIAGAAGFSDDGQPVSNSALMKKAMEMAASLGLPLIDHCEEKSLTQNGVVNEGRISKLLKLKGIPAAAEEIMVARDIILAKNFRWPVHLAHLSTRGSVDLLRWARAEGLPVTAEVTPHHLLLTEDVLLTSNPDAKVNPPLRTEEDIQSLRQALEDGLIDIIATDHAPHAEEEKKTGLEKAPFGINGLETAVPSLLDLLVRKQGFPLYRLIEVLTARPAKLLNLKDGGQIKKGEIADLTIIDLEGKTTITRESMASRSHNTPFLGTTFTGSIVMTIVSGQSVYQNKYYDKILFV